MQKDIKLICKALVLYLFAFFSSCRDDNSNEHGIETDSKLENFDSVADSTTFFERQDEKSFYFYHNSTREYYKATRIIIYLPQNNDQKKFVYLSVRKGLETVLLSYQISKNDLSTSFTFDDFTFNIKRDSMEIINPSGQFVDFKKK